MLTAVINDLPPNTEADEILYLGMGMTLHVALRIAVARPAHVGRQALIERAAAASAITTPLLAEHPAGDRPG